jgi:23S rRNA pseudouridine1911/1915/1917 synthase
LEYHARVMVPEYEKESISLKAQVTDDQAGQRIDQVAARLFPDYSRARLQAWMKTGELTVNGQRCKPRESALAGSWLVLDATLQSAENWAAEEMPLNIVYEDEELLVLDKQAELVVHPAAGHHQGTLVNGLLHYCPTLESLPRAGIVHRLDKDTTGLMVVAKNLKSHHALVKQLQSRSVSRQYEAVVQGVMTAGGTISAPLARHPVHRIKRAVSAGGQEAITHYRVVQRYAAHTHIRVNLETGRTHQIRVHMAHLKYPIVGDPLYGGRYRIPPNCAKELAGALETFKRQALHASELKLLHPATKLECRWEARLPDDFAGLLSLLHQDAGEGSA